MKILTGTNKDDILTTDNSHGNNIFTYVYGYSGDDIIKGYGTLNGGSGDDVIVGGGILNGGTGNDIIKGYGLLFGGNGNDIITGYGALNGGNGNDIIRETGPVSRIDGGNGNDEIYINGHETYSTNNITGGQGKDVFHFEYSGEQNNVITDFTKGVDKISLDSNVFSSLNEHGDIHNNIETVSRLSGFMSVGEDTHLIYDDYTGSIYYDVDGAYTYNAVEILGVDTGLSITASDFIIV